MLYTNGMVKPFLIIIYVLIYVNYIRVMVANICLFCKDAAPKRDLYERYTAALPSLKLRPIFAIQKTNRSPAFHSK